MSNTLEQFRGVVGSKFTLSPGGRLGAVDSAHEVFFGNYGGKPVAVKPHASESRARHEALVLDAVRGLGVLAVEPLVVLGNPNAKGAFLLTRRVPRLTSAASLPFQGDPIQVAESVRAMTDISDTLGTVHGAQISLGDAQVKNFGFSPHLISHSTGRPEVIVYDTEKGGTSKTGHIKSQPHSHDLGSLTQSLAYKGFGGPNMDSAAEALEQHVLDPYQRSAVAAGVPLNLTRETVNDAYGEFVIKHEQIGFAAQNSGHRS